MKKVLSLVLIALTAVILAACGSKIEGPQPGCTGADDEICIAFLPNESDSAGIQDRFLAFATEIEIALDGEFDIRYNVVDDYAATIAAMVSGAADISWGSPNSYTIANRESNGVVQPIVTFATDGDLEQSGYKAFIGTHIDNAGDFAHIDNDASLTEDEKMVKRLELLKGKSFSFVSPTSTSGRKVPTAALYSIFGSINGGYVEEKEDIHTKLLKDGGVFSEIKFGGNHQANVENVYDKVTYAGAWCCEFANHAGYDLETDFYILALTIVPESPIWVNTDNISAENIQKISDHFVSLTPETTTFGLYFNEAEGFEAGLLREDERWVAIDDSYYDFVRTM